MIPEFSHQGRKRSRVAQLRIANRKIGMHDTSASQKTTLKPIAEGARLPSIVRARAVKFGGQLAVIQICPQPVPHENA